MIITDRFVAINLPKTGSSFVRRVLKQLHSYEAVHNRLLRWAGLADRSGMVELILPVIDRQYPPNRTGQHGTVRQIPGSHRDGPIMSVVRNPLERYVSTYRFGWWKKNPHAPVEELLQVYPSYPDLAFGEYIEMMNTFGKRNRLGDMQPRTDVGFQTVQFLQFFCEDPKRLLSNLNDDAVEQQHYREALAEVTFLHQERLNEELHDFLVKSGYPEEDVAFVLQARPVNVTPSKAGKMDLAAHYSGALARQVIQQERVLFDLFPEYRAPAQNLLELRGGI